MPNEDLATDYKKELRRKARKQRREAEKSEMKKKMKKLEKTVRKMSRDASRNSEVVEQRFEAIEQDCQMGDQRFKKQNALMHQYAEDLQHSNLLLKTIVDSTVLPVIAGIIYKVMYRVGFGNHRIEPCPGKDHRSILLSYLEWFARFGFHSREEMETFANLVNIEISYYVRNADDE